MSTNIYNEASEHRKVGDVYKDTRGVEMVVIHFHYDYESLAEIAKYYWSSDVLAKKCEKNDEYGRKTGREYVRLYTMLYFTEYFVEGLARMYENKSDVIYCDNEYWIALDLTYRIMSTYEAAMNYNYCLPRLRQLYYESGYEEYRHMPPFERHEDEQQ